MNCGQSRIHPYSPASQDSVWNGITFRQFLEFHLTSHGEFGFNFQLSAKMGKRCQLLEATVWVRVSERNTD